MTTTERTGASAAAPESLVLLKHKLFHLDNHLPLVFSLVEEGVLRRPMFVAPDRATYDTIVENVVLYDGIAAAGGRLVHLMPRVNRLLRYPHTLWTVRRLLYRRVVTIQTSPDHGRLLRFLVSLNRRLWNGTSVLSQVNNMPHRLQQRVERFALATTAIDRRRQETAAGGTNPRAPSKRVTRARFDALLVSEPTPPGRSLWGVEVDPDIPEIEVGNTRRLRAWQEFLAANAGRYLARDIRRPYFLFVLSTLDTPNPSRRNIYDDTAVHKCLKVLRPYNDDILTVFKPHAVTDMERFDRLVRRRGYRNYVVSYAHPMILAREAKFAMAYHGSTVLMDACYMGCPTLDYAQYDSRGRHILDGHSLVREYVDFFVPQDSDETRIHQVLGHLIHGEARSERRADREGMLPVVAAPRLAQAFRRIGQ